MSDAPVEAIAEALNRATPGPWVVESYHRIYTENRQRRVLRDEQLDEADAHLIANAPTWLAQLLAALEAEQVAHAETLAELAKYRANPLWNVRAVEDPDFSMEGEKVSVWIDGLHYKVLPPGDYLGADIRNLPAPHIGSDREIWVEADGGMSVPVWDDSPLAIRGGEHFSTVPRAINDG